MDLRNVEDKYKGWLKDTIKNHLIEKAFPFAVLMEHLNGDFNIGTVIRNANVFGAQEVFYTGKKKWDKRGACGANHYLVINYIKDFDDIYLLKNKYSLVALEQVSSSEKLNTFTWPNNPLIIIGEEGCGISDELLELSDFKVEIPQFGSIRSLNAGTASGIAMYDFTAKYNLKNE